MIQEDIVGERYRDIPREKNNVEIGKKLSRIKDPKGFYYRYMTPDKLQNVRSLQKMPQWIFDLSSRGAEIRRLGDSKMAIVLWHFVFVGSKRST